jgi:hypothetical protein
LVKAIWSAILISVYIGYSTATNANKSLGWVSRALIYAIGNSVPIAVSVWHSTTAFTKHVFQWVIWALVHTVREAIKVCVHFCDAKTQKGVGWWQARIAINNGTSTLPNECFGRIVWAFIQAIRCSVLVRV